MRSLRHGDRIDGRAARAVLIRIAAPAHALLTLDRSAGSESAAPVRARCMDNVHASVCGTVRSDLPLGLPASADPVRLRVEVGAPASVPEDYCVERIEAERFRLSLPGEAVCDIDLGAASVLVHDAARRDRTALGHLVADHVLPRIAGEHMYCLHAAAVAVDGGAYVLAGQSGAGKSTLAIGLARSGAELLGDDCAAISGGRVHPTFRAGRIWPASLASLGLSGLAPDASGKVCLDARHGVRIASSAVPLAGILLVGTQSRRLRLGEALQLVLGQRFHLSRRSHDALLDEAVGLLDRCGPINEIDRRVWRPPARERHDGS